MIEHEGGAGWTGEWMSKGPGSRAPGGSSRCVKEGTQATHTCHFVHDGAPICAEARYTDGRKVLGPFLSSWVPLRPFDRRCRYCRSLLAGPAACVAMGIRPIDPK
jgi:hypothetical protein